MRRGLASEAGAPMRRGLLTNSSGAYGPRAAIFAFYPNKQFLMIGMPVRQSPTT
jgi:hypothetical protein